MVPILMLVYDISGLILPKVNVSCYLEGGQRQVPVFLEFCYVRFGCETLLVSIYSNLRGRPILQEYQQF